MEKAMEAFSRADSVGLEEEGSGVVETRMLRASEVKELLEGPDEPVPIPPAAPPEAPAEVVVPAAPETTVIADTESTELTEAEILGAKSAFVDPTESEGDVSLQPPAEGSPVPSELSEEFTSSRYNDVAVAEPQVELVAETASPDDKTQDLEYDLPEPPVVDAPPPSEAKDVPTTVHTTPRPESRTDVTPDGFEYPAEVYSAMGQARLKQARFFVVQAKYVDAKRVVDLARELFERAKDERGLKELEKLIGSIKGKS
jgi:hypothetical protein